MRLKYDGTLAYVAQSCGRDWVQISRDIVDGLEQAGFLKDTPAVYGERLNECIEGGATVAAVAEIFRKATGVDVLKCDMWDYLCGCTVMGNGDCPQCGGRLQFDEVEGHQDDDGDYYTPNGYIVDYYIYKCPLCGAKIKSEKEL